MKREAQTVQEQPIPFCVPGKHEVPDGMMYWLEPARVDSNGKWYTVPGSMVRVLVCNDHLGEMRAHS